MATPTQPSKIYERMKRDYEILKRAEFTPVPFTPPILWSYLMNGDLSPKVIVKKLLDAGYEVIAENMPSPVGKVPEGSTVLTDYNDRRAVWIYGKLYQKAELK